MGDAAVERRGYKEMLNEYVAKTSHEQCSFEAADADEAETRGLGRSEQ